MPAGEGLSRNVEGGSGHGIFQASLVYAVMWIWWAIPKLQGHSDPFVGNAYVGTALALAECLHCKILFVATGMLIHQCEAWLLSGMAIFYLESVMRLVLLTLGLLCCGNEKKTQAVKQDGKEKLVSIQDVGVGRKEKRKIESNKGFVGSIQNSVTQISPLKQLFGLSV